MLRTARGQVLARRTSKRMRITVRLFAAHREAAGTNTYIAELPDGATVSDAYAGICDSFPNIASSAGATAFALNHAHVGGDEPLHDGDEVAILPPVAGG